MSLVVESWTEITAIENYESVAGEMLFRRIFEINPDSKHFFAFTSNETRAENVYQSQLFQTHSRAVITTVDSAVNLLKSNNMETMVKVLRGLGTKHASMNLEQAHYDLVGQALLDTLAKALGDSFTVQVKDAWIDVYKVIVQHMMEGVKSANNGRDTTTCSAKGDKKSDMEDAMEELRRITAEKVQQALLNYEKQALANQERIQAEVDAEMKRVAEFKARLALKKAEEEAQAEASKRKLEDAEEASTSGETDTNEMDSSDYDGMDASDVLYNERSCVQLVFGKLFALAAN